MQQLIGAFSQDEPTTQCLSMTLHPAGIGTGWSLCGRTADYAAGTFIELISERLVVGQSLRRKDLESTLCYILNELLENAIKFRSGGAIKVELGLAEEAIICAVRNQLASREAPAIAERLAALLRSNPEELLLHTAEANGMASGSAGSGLGYLTILTCDGARLAWMLESIETGHFVLTTQAMITI